MGMPAGPVHAVMSYHGVGNTGPFAVFVETHDGFIIETGPSY